MSEARPYLTLREMQLVSLSMLLEFDEFCKKHGIRYALCGGTMLGAARHQGFIPWDDDIDLMMTREEYEKLLSMADLYAEEFPGRQMISYRDKTLARDYSRIITKEYMKEEKDISPKDCPWLGMDFFPLDVISDNQDDFEKQVKDRVFWHEVFVTCSSPFNAGSTPLKRLVRNLFRPIAFAIGRFRAAKKSDEICRRFEHSGGRDIAIVCGMYGTRERWPRSAYEPLATLPFEGHEFPVPHDYDVYMRAIFGDDYMELPPEEKRRPPRIKAWKV